MPSAELTQFPLEEEYQKKTGITPKDIAALRSWMDTQPHLPSKYITDLDLILAYHSCNCSTGVTKQVLDTHYTARTLFTNYFKDRHFDNRMKKVSETTLISPLPMRTKEGYAILYTHFLDYDAKNFHYGDSLKTFIMIMDLWQYIEGTWPGFMIVIDLEGVTLGHVARLDLQNVQHIMYYLQEAMFVKLKGLHFKNAPSFMDKILMIIKPFMKKELMDMLGVHIPGSKTLEEVIPLDALPKESGGKYKSRQECKEVVLEMIHAGEAYIKSENQKRVTESLRSGKPKTISDIFGGVEGSFKKLDID
ncbi:alpha-tocopherol transfer protein-like [Epargyreus clarus]|uniref:alpha-tocopherol transfer protein-like n=1 Tax=Epargyreus clarus TaxID=520877 RepID=UPI003C2FAA66